MQDSSILQFSFWGRHQPSQDSILLEGSSGQVIELFPKAEIIHLEEYFSPVMVSQN